MKKLLFYTLRWQLSTPILAVIMLLPMKNTVVKTILANLIGALIFFPVDGYIFRRTNTTNSK